MASKRPENPPAGDALLIRDYFAAAAMQAMLTTDEGQMWDNIQLAQEAYKLADAMLKERAK